MSDEIRVTGMGPIDPKWPKARKQAHVEARRILVEQEEQRGATQRQMASSLGVDLHTINDDLKAVRNARREAFGAVTVREHRDMTALRLEEERRRVIVDMTPDPGDPNAIPPRSARAATLTRWQGHRLLLQIERQRCDLFGLNAPAKVQLQEFTQDDEAHGSMDEAPRERTLADLAGDPAVAVQLAKVVHLADRAAG
jgi:hypothetical protein